MRFYIKFNSNFYVSDQGDEVTLQTNTAKIISIILGLFFGVFVISLYQSELLARLLIPKETPLFTELSQLLNLIRSKQYSLLELKIYENGLFVRSIQEAKTKIFMDIAESLKNNPIELVESTEIINKKISTGKSIIYYVSEIEAYYDLSTFKNPCDFQIIPIDEIKMGLFGLFFRKGNPIKHFVDEEITKKTQEFQRIYNRYLNFYKDKINQICEEKTKSSLNFLSISGLLFLFGTGIFASLVAILWEMLKFKFSYQKKTHEWTDFLCLRIMASREWRQFQ